MNWAKPEDVDDTLVAWARNWLALPRESERVSLARAGGRTLAQNVYADRDHPPFHRIMMDGYLVRGADLKSTAPGSKKVLLVDKDRSADAGGPAVTHVECGHAVRCSTGGALDHKLLGEVCVLPVEDVETLERTVDSTQDRIAVMGSPQFFPEAHLHKQGSDIQRGNEALRKGTFLGAMSAALCATFGYSELDVVPLPRIHLITSGDEVVPVEEIPNPWQIRSSHPAMLDSLLADFAPEVSHRHARDHAPCLRAEIEKSLECADLVLLTGGVSKGHRDLIRPCLEEVGCTVQVHKVMQRPGHPLLIATRGKALIIGLPGNPLSVTSCAVRYLRPLLSFLQRGQWPQPLRLAGTSLDTDTASQLRKLQLPHEHRFVAFSCLTQQSIAEKKVKLHLHNSRNSGDLMGWVGAQALLEMPPERQPENQSDNRGYAIYPFSLAQTPDLTHDLL